MSDLSQQIEHLRHTMNARASVTHQQLHALDNQVHAEFDGVFRHIDDVSVRIQNLHGTAFAKLTALAQVVGVIPAQRPAPVVGLRRDSTGIEDLRRAIDDSFGVR
jgi:hypothetical protein